MALISTNNTLQYWNFDPTDEFGVDVDFGFVRLTIGYDESLLPGPEHLLQILHQQEDESWLVLETLSRDLVNNTITVRAEHFSLFDPSFAESGGRTGRLHGGTRRCRHASAGPSRLSPPQALLLGTPLVSK